MAEPRSTSTRRAVLSYDQLKDLFRGIGIELPDLFVKDYQGILQDFVYTSDEIDGIDTIVDGNTKDIIELQESHYPNIASQVQFLQRQLNGLPEFTMDTEGFTMDSTEFTMDKVMA